MKTVKARDPQEKVKESVDLSQPDRVVVTRRGKAAAAVASADGRDWDDVELQASSKFWKLIEQRRSEPTMSMKELKTRLKRRKK